MGLVAARFVLVRTCGRRERPPALCAVWAWSPLACGRVPYPPYARCGMGRLCGERMGPGCAAVSVASDRREQETRLGAGVGGWPRPPLAAWGAGLHRPAVRHGGRGCTGPATCERFACPKDARNAAWGRRRRFMPMGCAIYPRIYVARCDAVWRGVSRLGRYILGYARHAPAPAAAGASPRPPLAPWGRGWPGMLRASVSSVLPTQETRLAAPPRSLCRASRPHQPSEVWRAAALQNVFVSPGFAGRAGSLRPWAQTFLTPAAACAGRKRVPCGHLGRRPKAT